MRKCSACGLLKEPSGFYPSRPTRCKLCGREKSKRYRLEHPEKYAAWVAAHPTYQRDWYLQHRQKQGKAPRVARDPSILKVTQWQRTKADPERLAKKRLSARLLSRARWEREHPGCNTYRPSGRPGVLVGRRGPRPGTAEKIRAREAELAEMRLRRQSANWLYLANQIPGCLDPKRCKMGHWARPEDMSGKGRLCRACRREKAQRRRALKIGNGGKCSAAEWVSILERHDHTCQHCGVRGEMTQDHILSLSLGGRHVASNLQPLCHPCNSMKRNTVTGAVQSLIPGLRSTLA
jgi:hypothetical protein